MVSRNCYGQVGYSNFSLCLPRGWSEDQCKGGLVILIGLLHFIFKWGAVHSQGLEVPLSISGLSRFIFFWKKMKNPPFQSYSFLVYFFIIYFVCKDLFQSGILYIMYCLSSTVCVLSVWFSILVMHVASWQPYDYSLWFLGCLFFCLGINFSFFFLFVLVADLFMSSNCSAVVSFELLNLIQKNCSISELQAFYCWYWPHC